MPNNRPLSLALGPWFPRAGAGTEAPRPDQRNRNRGWAVAMFTCMPALQTNFRQTQTIFSLPYSKISSAVPDNAPPDAEAGHRDAGHGSERRLLWSYLEKRK